VIVTEVIADILVFVARSVVLRYRSAGVIIPYNMGSIVGHSPSEFRKAVHQRTIKVNLESMNVPSKGFTVLYFVHKLDLKLKHAPLGQVVQMPVQSFGWSSSFKISGLRSGQFGA